ncbi:MAG: heavy-metal-associated domain-containing protein [Bacillota bacterium]
MAEMTLQVSSATDIDTIQDLENILLKQEGIERALVDTENGEVKITYDGDQITFEEVERLIHQNGFQA